VECQSASETGTRPRPGEGGRIVDENDSGEPGIALPRDEGREPGGDCRRCVGSLGEGTRCAGEPGLDTGPELLA
jgi:hypothetical protein